MTPGPEYAAAARDVLARAASRAEAALGAHGPFASAHEAESVVREEMEELAAEVRESSERRSLWRMKREALDVAAAALRFAAQLEFQDRIDSDILQARYESAEDRTPDSRARAEALVEEWLAWRDAGGGRLR